MTTAQRKLMPWRWEVAELLNRLPWTCWSDLVGWVMCVDRKERRDYPLRKAFAWKPCRGADYDRCGSCYCGKFQDRAQILAAQEAIDAEYPPQPTDPWADTPA